MSSPNCQNEALLRFYAFIVPAMITLTILKGAKSADAIQYEPEPPSSIVFYMGIDRDAMLAYLATNASTTNSTVSGLLQGYRFPMSSSADDVDDPAKVIGTMTGPALFVATGGWAAIGSQGEVLMATLIYDDGTFKGSICMRGHFVNTASAELAIVGGTKAFRRVQGYALPTVVSESPSILERWEIHLFYP